jgi:hypothetical protein
MFEKKDHFSLYPLHFFALSSDCHYLSSRKQIPSLSTHRLPSTQDLTNEEVFADVAMGWHEEGIGLYIQVHQPFQRSSYPHIDRGDSVELFFDTRDLKSAGFNTRFCHHFFFLPKMVEGVCKGEKTHFRTEDRHPLAESHLLDCQVCVRKRDYTFTIFIPTDCLHGYDPKQFDRLGFTYRMNRSGNPSQHFAVLSEEYTVDQHPSLWASLQLVK